jgi:hypothetical protein
MAWDSSRPVPWNRLIREWLIYAAIMTAVFLLFFRANNVVGAIAGVLISGPLYLGFGAVMAKFGYQRTRLRDVRGDAKASAAASSSTSGASGDDATPRPKPAPTSRTAGGGNRPKSSSRRKR